MVVDPHVEIELEDRERPRRRRHRRGAPAPARVASGPPVSAGPEPGTLAGLLPDALSDAPEVERRRGPLVAGAAVGGVLLLVVGFALGRSGGGVEVVEDDAATAATPAATTTVVEPPPALASDDTLPSTETTERERTRRTTTTTTDVPVAITEIGRPLLPVPTGIVLVGVTRGGDVVEIELDTGRMTETELRYGAVDGWSTSIAAGSDVTFVSVNGYVYRIDRGEEPVVAEGVFSSPPFAGSAPFSADAPNVFWTLGYDHTDGTADLVPVDADGNPVGSAVDLGTYWAQGVDGRGRVLVRAPGGTYAVGRAGTERLTPGSVVAVGRNHALVRECDEQLSCGDWMVDVATGERRPVALEASGDSEYLAGSYPGVAPDGSAVVIPSPFNPGRLAPTFSMVDLTTGTATELASYDGAPISFGWSDDSRFGLFLDDDVLRVIDRTTGTTSTVADEIPEMLRFVLRPSAAVG